VEEAGNGKHEGPEGRGTSVKALRGSFQRLKAQRLAEENQGDLPSTPKDEWVGSRLIRTTGGEVHQKKTARLRRARGLVRRKRKGVRRGVLEQLGPTGKGVGKKGGGGGRLDASVSRQ